MTWFSAFSTDLLTFNLTKYDKFGIVRLMKKSLGPSNKRGSYNRRDVFGVRPKKRGKMIRVGMAEMNKHCNERLRESGAAINYTEEMHTKALVREARAERAAKAGDAKGGGV